MCGRGGDGAGGAGFGGWGTDTNEDGRTSIAESLADMTDGGGSGKSGDTFGGALGDISNSLGATPSGSGRDPTGLASIAAPAFSRDDEGNLTNTAAAIRGAVTGGLPGMVASVAANQVTGGKGLSGLLGGLTKGADSATGKTASGQTRPRSRPAGLGQEPMRGEADDIRVTPTVSTAAPADNGATVTLSDMSAAAGGGGFQAVPNPDYNPNDPMSQQFLSNPTYAQLLAYRDSGTVTRMSYGGTAQIGMGSLGGPPMPGAQRAYLGRSSTQNNPLQQYGGYLEQQYGDAGFDQKKDQFLQEVLQKEQQTFSGGGGLQPSSFPASGSSDPSPLVDTNRVPEHLTQLQTSLPAWAQVTNMAEGGELTVAPPEGGNEKTMISDAVSAVKGEMSEEQSAVVLGQFLANYGEEALRDLVDKVQSGEFDDTVDRFANGEAGEVRGPGDGSGVDDKVPASLEGQQDVLLADGEFVLRKKTADALEKKYGGGFLDAVNKSESTAPNTMQQYMARN